MRTPVVPLAPIVPLRLLCPLKFTPKDGGAPCPGPVLLCLRILDYISHCLRGAINPCVVWMLSGGCHVVSHRCVCFFVRGPM
ncbi:hypothetical protein GDO81_024568 [Engystomops pustulosus]|uniref:Secreted protein n=1 Tax=Engystomops pustulosus TaxID=76066 RepID=A0AAV6YR11_ENGPU|nr:hypothetical protein GDO81_024568 [Engystomops pustulosus]